MGYCDACQQTNNHKAHKGIGASLRPLSRHLIDMPIRIDDLAISARGMPTQKRVRSRECTNSRALENSQGDSSRSDTIWTRVGIEICSRFQQLSNSLLMREAFEDFGNQQVRDMPAAKVSWQVTKNAFDGH
jgi:hypothetical protein